MDIKKNTRHYSLDSQKVSKAIKATKTPKSSEYYTVYLQINNKHKPNDNFSIFKILKITIKTSATTKRPMDKKLPVSYTHLTLPTKA